MQQDQPSHKAVISHDLAWMLRKLFMLCQHREARLERDNDNLHLLCPDCLGRTSGVTLERKV